ncbi:hypothetical protein BO70DRAFT_165248 [Aspergillus heteromorphus CBS 117.55]|uniref:Uncharacterized protein n=1 Tax=Aspergillus heteromorphus CBS 117.55 TaxID=1448321 RepID=A0A317WT82_9EURO|nr:uncharacterized protein BO70DRAFT_165248 [Aspergillus heteromorphus CBS 117.55]PWY89305.1 hypothetical protein BO70DRAFT_165248 [Aspergillus heteromorphus CBS 117.55]
MGTPPRVTLAMPWISLPPGSNPLPPFPPGRMRIKTLLVFSRCTDEGYGIAGWRGLLWGWRRCTSSPTYVILLLSSRLAGSCLELLQEGLHPAIQDHPRPLQPLDGCTTPSGTVVDHCKSTPGYTITGQIV